MVVVCAVVGAGLVLGFRMGNPWVSSDIPIPTPVDKPAPFPRVWVYLWVITILPTPIPVRGIPTGHEIHG